MRRGLAIALCLAGCGIFGSSGSTTPAEDGPRLAMAEVRGARVVMLRRPTPGHVHVALWLDAGARDASPPQLATIAAWVAAARAGDDVQARVLPDGTSFEVSCETATIGSCVAALGRVIATRDATEEEVSRLRVRLGAVRRRAASDDARLAEALALAALLGDGAAGFAPLGAAEDDEAVGARAVSAFLGAHYGPRRAMLIGAGDARPEALTDAVSSALGASVPAGEARATRTLAGADGTRTEARARAAVGSTSVAAIAIAASGIQRAAVIAHAIAGSDIGARLETEGPLVHAFEVRGGALVLAHVAHEEIDRAAVELAVATQTAMAEETRARTLALDDDAVTAARAIGLRWVATGDAAALALSTLDADASDTSPGTDEPANAGALALGVLIAGGRADSDEADPDRAARERATAIADSALEAARAAAQPASRGEVSDHAASVVTANGARIDVRRRSEDARAAVAMRFAGGAASDPPSVHGRAALLAVLAAETCPALGPGGAAERAAAVGATIAPRVDARSWGLVVEAPASHWREALDLATRCALAVTPSRTDVERARILLLDRLDGGAVLAAWAARSLAPDAPGGIAPLGGLDAVRETSVASVRRAWREAATGARISVAIVGDVPVDDAVARAARRVARLEAGTAVGRTPEVEVAQPDGPLAEDYPGPSPRVVATWRAGAGAARNADAARVLADVLAVRLGSAHGLRTVWADGGVDARGAWAAVALDASEAALADLPSRIAGTLGTIEDESLRDAYAARARARARGEARPAEAADAVARRRLTPAPRSSPDATWAALRAASPGYVIGRPRTAE